MSSINVQKVPVVYSEVFREDYDTVDCECPDRVVSICAALGGIAEFHEPRPCSDEELLRCHSPSLIADVKGHPGIFRVATLSAGGAVTAARMALEEPTFALIRPPGHHAGRNFNGGFCFFNNMTVALYSLKAAGLIRKALIVDIDLHYGNGTFDIVKDDTDFVFRNISAIKRDGFYNQVEEALSHASDVDMVGCSAGFDTYLRDWGGLLFTDDFRKIGSMIAASNPCFFSILEGGYYIPDLGTNVRAYLEGIREARSRRSHLQGIGDACSS